MSNQSASKPRFIDRIVALSREEGVSEEFIVKVRKLWEETSVEIHRALDDFMRAVMFEPRLCLQCGLDVPVNSNGLCDSCLKKMYPPKSTIDLQEGT